MNLSIFIGFVCEACSVFSTPLEEIDNAPEKVMLNKSKGKYVALSNVHDYIYRPSAFGSVNLYDWIRCANKKRKSKNPKKDSIKDDMAEDSDDYGNNTESEDELDIIGDKFVGGGNNNESESDWVDSDQSSENMNYELNIDENVQ